MHDRIERSNDWRSTGLLNGISAFQVLAQRKWHRNRLRGQRFGIRSQWHNVRHRIASFDVNENKVIVVVIAIDKPMFENLNEKRSFSLRYSKHCPKFIPNNSTMKIIPLCFDDFSFNPRDCISNRQLFRLWKTHRMAKRIHNLKMNGMFVCYFLEMRTEKIDLKFIKSLRWTPIQRDRCDWLFAQSVWRFRIVSFSAAQCFYLSPIGADNERWYPFLVANTSEIKPYEIMIVATPGQNDGVRLVISSPLTKLTMSNSICLHENAWQAAFNFYRASRTMRR